MGYIRMAQGAEWRRWLVGLGCAAAALALRFALAPWLGDGRAPFLVFAPAAMLAAWAGGFWPGVAVAAAGAVLGDVFFLPPLGVRSPAEFAQTAGYLATALAGAVACAALARSRERERALSGDPKKHTDTLRLELSERHKTERALRETERHTRRAIESNVIGILIADFAGNVLDANDALLDLVGRTRDDLDAGRVNATELTPPELRHLDARAADQLRAGVRPEPYEKQLERPDGTRVPVLVGLAPLPGAPNMTVGYVVDLSSQKRAEQSARGREQALRDSEDRLRLLTDAVPALVSYIDGGLVYRVVNRAYTEWFGCEAGAIVGRTVRDVLGEEAFARAEPYLRRALAGETIDYEAELPYKHGPPRYVHAHYLPHVGEDGAVAGVYAMVQDLTARRRADEALRASEHRFAAFMDNIPGASWMKDLSGRYVYANAEASRIFDSPPAAMHGKTDEDLFPPDTASHFRENDARVLREGTLQTVEVLRHPDGVEHHSLVSKFAVPGPDGAPAYVGGVAIDITARLAAEQALRDGERRYRFLAESIPQIVFTARPDGVVNYHNERLTRYLGATREQLRELGWIHFRHPDDRERASRSWERAVRSGEPYECTYRMLRGSDQAWRWHLARAVPMRDEQGNVRLWFGTCTDIDDQKRAEDALRRSEAGLARAQHIAGMGSWEIDNATKQVLWSDEMYRLFGVERESFTPSLEAFFALVPAEEHPSIQAALERAVRERTTYQVDHRIVLADGSERHVSEQAEIVFGPGGEPLRFVGTTLDITQRKRTEEALAAANRAKDQFLATLSHELRTPLTPVVLAVDALRTDGSLPMPVREDLEMIRRNVGLEAKLIDDLLDLTRVTRGKLELRPEMVDVHASLEHAVRSCAAGAEVRDKGLLVRTDLRAARRHVRADASRLEQVFFNLLRNAMKFTPAGGSVDVRTRDAAERDVGEAPRIVIEVADSGIGIGPSVLPRIFDAFEQGDRAVTRRFGGLGLGLAICKAIVEMHGGTIRAHSEGRDRGATFVVEMPVAAAETTYGPAPSAHAASSGLAPDRDFKPRILLVEDHQTTAHMMARLFQRLAYDVKVAGDTASARRLAEQHSFDLVVSDLGLPDGSGTDLMRDLRQRHGLVGIALSGYGMEEDIQQSKAAGFVEHLVKPISFDALEATIRRVVRPQGQLASTDGD